MQALHVRDIGNSAGLDLGHSPWLSVTQDMIGHFVTATLDDQWIHQDTPETRSRSPFGKPIAHGFLVLSLTSHLLQQTVSLGGARMMINYGLNRVRFTHVVTSGSRIRLHAKVASAEPTPEGAWRITFDCVLELEGSAKPACVLEWIGLVFPE